MTDVTPAPVPPPAIAPSAPASSAPSRAGILPAVLAVLALGASVSQPWWVGYVKPAAPIVAVQPEVAPAPAVDLAPVLTRLEVLEDRPTPRATGEKADTSALEAELATVKETQAAQQKSNDELRKELSQLKDKIKDGPENTAHKFFLATALQLTTAWQQGVPFKAQWQALLSAATFNPDLLGSLEDAAPELLPWLEKGVPTLLKLTQDFPAAARAELQAARPDGASFGEKVSRQLQGLVVIRRQGEALSANSASLDAQLNAAETALKQGDLSGALSALPSPAQSNELKTWLGAAKARAQVDGLAQALTAQAGKYLEPVADEGKAP